ncbi:site-specific integrase [Priestia megaterium]|uniref:site-specific integrase n=1 Tax=Priestia megaterium TaxID=1404 RepID=UPI001375264A|nr:site-specific integrase [Priestia megaterium]MDH3174736.1 site-specific integrase [Priestia megaterium]
MRIIERTELSFVKERNDRITPHYFRHFYAIYSRQQGADIFLIQKELGHSDRKTTERYLEKVLQREQEIGLMWKEQDF